MAYAALDSLFQSISQLRSNTDEVFRREDQRCLGYLLERLQLCLNILQNSAKKLNNHEKMKSLEEKIRDVSYEAEYFFESKLTDCCHEEDIAGRVLTLAEEIESIKRQLLEIHGKKYFDPFLQENHSSSLKKASGEDFDVEDTQYLIPLLWRSRFSYLTTIPVFDFFLPHKSPPGMQIISISGEEGSGKTALSRIIYEDSLQYFPIHVWITVPRQTQAKELLLGLLNSLTEFFDDIDIKQMLCNELCEYLSKFLQRDRYLIIIDNMWNPKVWNDIKCSFPDQCNGSRVLFTSHFNWAVSNYVTNIKNFSGSYKLPMIPINFTLRGLCSPAAQRLFHDLVFGEKSCPEELRYTATRLIELCKFSPLAIIMVAGYLSKISNTKDSWITVERIISEHRFEFDSVIPLIISALLEIAEVTDSSNTETADVLDNKIYTEILQSERFPLVEGPYEVTFGKEYVNVGLEASFDGIVGELIGSTRKLEFLAIVGMAGIGKTTLAKKLFDDRCIADHFDRRAWIKVSQVYRIRDLMIQLLQCVTELKDDDIYKDTNMDLQEKLYQSLRNWRYLIVIDDMWSSAAWNELKSPFRDDKMGSRILFTSRQQTVATALNCKTIHCMSLLSENESWELLQRKVFAKNNICHPDLAVIGKLIAKKCRGLPLAVVVIAGVLLKIGEKLEGWKEVEMSVSEFVFSNQHPCEEIFALSYKYLPDHLRSCFLYMGAFPEGSEIEAWRLNYLWIAEGFVDPLNSMSLEELAEDYLNELIDRSLILVGKRRSNGKIKTCRIHDLLLEFCIREAEKKNFLNVIKDCDQIRLGGRTDKRCRFSFQSHTYDYIHLAASKSMAQSSLFFGVSPIVPDIFLWYFDFKLLRVLDIVSLRFDYFPIEQIGKLFVLRYLALTATFELPGSLFKLQKLQTLVVHGPWIDSDKNPELPYEFWGSLHLRHLQLEIASSLPHPKFPYISYRTGIYLSHLHTLSKVTLASCSNESFDSIPTIKKLGVYETEEDFWAIGLWNTFLQNLFRLYQLQTLNLSCFCKNEKPLPLPNRNAFPESLKKLTLKHSYLPWKDMKILGGVPNLEVLKLKNHAFTGPEWETEEGGFGNLRYLLIEKTDLVNWKLENCHFPRLQHLVLKSCNLLEGIPDDIGNIPTLKQIELHYCSFSAERSAKEIRDDQLDYQHELDVSIRTHRLLSSASLQAMDD